MKSACAFFKVETKLTWSQKEATNIQTIQTLYRKFCELGYPPCKLPRPNLRTQRLHVARCESHRQETLLQAQKNNAFFFWNENSLSLGTLRKLTFKRNYMLEKVLRIVQYNTSIEAIPAKCSKCGECLGAGNTVHLQCGCDTPCCQRCQRRSLQNIHETYHSSPVQSCTCKHSSVSLSNIAAAVRLEDVLLSLDKEKEKNVDLHVPSHETNSLGKLAKEGSWHQRRLKEARTQHFLVGSATSLQAGSVPLGPSACVKVSTSSVLEAAVLSACHQRRREKKAKEQNVFTKRTGSTMTGAITSLPGARTARRPSVAQSRRRSQTSRCCAKTSIISRRMTRGGRPCTPT